mmetsp:Transcript_16306/g.28524  ORF Transcript_16306/g.28524 Transcript_16306/m.28524 type:complete len:237 (+) Transcript_16306:327-1037(+)|eukprot:CAMPEP_0184696248 /NCGR_PEP_ID=MMETSP0313-20130426/3604_1 /TAXON_ID=2792 /ORGANISM="Porphyridium aerugineum, Strain SAG 1380-2" /LENGTH=236 /DNA_ID=CAMNT_0027154833 /DNA_START=228 /DNA_END=938 /DNA_ORIENTATION=+
MDSEPSSSDFVITSFRDSARAGRFTDKEMENMLGVPWETFETEMKVTFDAKDTDKDEHISSKECYEILKGEQFPFSEQAVEGCLKLLEGYDDTTKLNFAKFMKFIYDICGVELALAEGRQMARTVSMVDRSNEALVTLVKNVKVVEKILKNFDKVNGTHIPAALLLEHLFLIPELVKEDAAVRAAIKSFLLKGSESSSSTLDEHEFTEFLADLCSEKIDVDVEYVLFKLEESSRKI